MQVHLYNPQVKFVYEGHQDKVKVTGAKKRRPCLFLIYANQTPSKERYVFNKYYYYTKNIKRLNV